MSLLQRFVDDLSATRGEDIDVDGISIKSVSVEVDGRSVTLRSKSSIGRGNNNGDRRFQDALVRWMNDTFESPVPKLDQVTYQIVGDVVYFTVDSGTHKGEEEVIDMSDINRIMEAWNLSQSRADRTKSDDNDIIPHKTLQKIYRLLEPYLGDKADLVSFETIDAEEGTYVCFYSDGIKYREFQVDVPAGTVKEYGKRSRRTRSLDSDEIDNLEKIAPILENELGGQIDIHAREIYIVSEDSPGVFTVRYQNRRYQVNTRRDEEEVTFIRSRRTKRDASALKVIEDGALILLKDELEDPQPEWDQIRCTPTNGDKWIEVRIIAGEHKGEEFTFEYDEAYQAGRKSQPRTKEAGKQILAAVNSYLRETQDKVRGKITEDQVECVLRPEQDDYLVTVISGPYEGWTFPYAYGRVEEGYARSAKPRQTKSLATRVADLINEYLLDHVNSTAAAQGVNGSDLDISEDQVEVVNGPLRGWIFQMDGLEVTAHSNPRGHKSAKLTDAQRKALKLIRKKLDVETIIRSLNEDDLKELADIYNIKWTDRDEVARNLAAELESGGIKMEDIYGWLDEGEGE
jgi:hypothetical protein